MPEGLYIGLMSGTSVDGVDAALLDFSGGTPELLSTLEYPIPAALQASIHKLCLPGQDEIEQLGVLDRQLGETFADSTLALLRQAGTPPEAVRAIGSHGQTVRHRPQSGGHPAAQAFTLQLGDPNSIAEITGIDTVADFRRRDIAAGGEGAPLAPAFHRAVFSATNSHRAIVNIGGIANATLLQGEELLAGYDTGPGNTLLDQWYRLHHGEGFDLNGGWAAAGEVDDELLATLLQHPYLAARGPRSTGREAFNLEWLQAQLPSGLEAAAVQATLAEFTAETIARGLDSGNFSPQEIYVCGGGAHNGDLLRRLARLAAPTRVAITTALGIDPDWVEAAAFAWLAQRHINGLAGNAPEVTGARSERILGALYPGGR